MHLILFWMWLIAMQWFGLPSNMVLIWSVHSPQFLCTPEWPSEAKFLMSEKMAGYIVLVSFLFKMFNRKYLNFDYVELCSQQSTFHWWVITSQNIVYLQEFRTEVNLYEICWEIWVLKLISYNLLTVIHHNLKGYMVHLQATYNYSNQLIIRPFP